MFGKFLPRTTNFFIFFDSLAVIIKDSSQALLEMISMEFAEQVMQAEKITKYEKEADEVTHKCIDALHKTFITPFEREDIHRLITRLDDILDSIEDIAAKIILYRLDTRKRDATSLATILCSSVQEIQTIVKALRKKGPLEATNQAFVRIHQLENDGDTAVRRAIGALFDEEKNYVELIKWKEIFENLEEAIDCCEAVANIVEGVMIENS